MDPIRGPYNALMNSNTVNVESYKIIYDNRNSGHYIPFFLAPVEGFGSPSGSQWWPLATTRGALLGYPSGGVHLILI